MTTGAWLYSIVCVHDGIYNTLQTVAVAASLLKKFACKIYKC